MANLTTDYLIVGAGAVGLAFADTLIDEDPACRIIIADRHARPGGHWNDAYAFVALHQPSATYGVNSLELCSGQIDTDGHNAGMYPLARHAEILAYYDRVMREKLLVSGRVTYLPLTDYRGEAGGAHTLRGILSQADQSVQVRRKLVDATWFQTSVPATHTPAFTVAPGARRAIPSDLPGMWQDTPHPPSHFVILGGGKTAMDTAVWLIEAGIAPDRIEWVRPRDSWMFNRSALQPAHAALEALVEFQLALVESAAAAATGRAMCLLLEQRGVMLRIDPAVEPAMFHFAVISAGEVALMQQITRVHRQGRVTAIEPEAIVFGGVRVAVPPGTMFIDCTATAVPFNARANHRPFFDGDTITLQLVQTPFVPYSAALAAFLEVHFATDEERNALCNPAPLTDCPDTYPYAVMANLLSGGMLSGNAKTDDFNARSRLHPTGPEIARLKAERSPRLAMLATMGDAIRANVPGVIKLGMAAKALHESRRDMPR